MEGKIKKTKEALSRTFDMPEDITMDLPKITISGNNEIIIENHRGVKVFSQNQVIVNSTVGLIKVDGYDFEILFMGGDTIVISGRFKNLVYEESK